eukprot:2088611-Amphidinium_carterae.1
MCWSVCCKNSSTLGHHSLASSSRVQVPASSAACCCFCTGSMSKTPLHRWQLRLRDTRPICQRCERTSAQKASTCLARTASARFYLANMSVLVKHDQPLVPELATIPLLVPIVVLKEEC